MTEVVLRADEHFEGLREPAWSRFRSRHGLYSRDRFDDAYAEWWTREIARAVGGRPSRAKAPAAFVAEGVHRVLVDEARARARGLARGEEKAALALVDIDDQTHLVHPDDTAAAARHEALVHRVLELVRDRLGDRELRVFVWSFLYLQSSAATAGALGLSEPRVKKDRRRIAAKVGAEVWAVLSAELGVCASYTDKKLLAVCELITDHVEDCPECAEAVGGLRRGALAAVAPVELFALAPDPVGALDAVLGRLLAPLQRSAEVVGGLPPGGRLAAAAAAVAVAVSGGAVATGSHEREPAAGARAVGRSAPAPAAATPAVARTAPTAPTTAAVGRTASPADADRRDRRRSTRRRRTADRAARPAATAVPAPQATPAPALTPVPATPQAPPPQVAPTGGGATPGEFGFERR